MDQFYDDAYDDEFKKSSSPKKNSKKRNPEGPYQIDMKFCGVEYKITIENKTFDKFKVIAESECCDPKDVNIESKINNLKKLERYLELEGFYLAARKWNMFF